MGACVCLGWEEWGAGKERSALTRGNTRARDRKRAKVAGQHAKKGSAWREHNGRGLGRCERGSWRGSQGTLGILSQTLDVMLRQREPLISFKQESESTN